MFKFSKIKNKFKKLFLGLSLTSIGIGGAFSISANTSDIAEIREEQKELELKKYLKCLEVFNDQLRPFSKTLFSDIHKKMGIDNYINNPEVVKNTEKIKIGIIDLGFVNPYLFLGRPEKVKLYLPTYRGNHNEERLAVDVVTGNNIIDGNYDSLKKALSKNISDNVSRNSDSTNNMKFSERILYEFFNSHSTQISNLIAGDSGILKNAEIHSASLNSFTYYNDSRNVAFYDYKKNEVVRIANPDLRTNEWKKYSDDHFYSDLKSLDLIIKKMLASKVNIINISVGLQSLMYNSTAYKEFLKNLTKPDENDTAKKPKYKNLDEFWKICTEFKWHSNTFQKERPEEFEKFKKTLMNLKHEFLFEIYQNNKHKFNPFKLALMYPGHPLFTYFDNKNDFNNWGYRNNYIEKVLSLDRNRWHYSKLSGMIDEYANKYNVKFFISAGNYERANLLLRYINTYTNEWENNWKLRWKMNFNLKDQQSFGFIKTAHNAIYVGAIDRKGEFMNFSDQGAFDISDFPLIVNYGSEIGNKNIYYFDSPYSKYLIHIYKKNFIGLRGTSFATPLAASLVGLYCASENKKPGKIKIRELRAALASSSFYTDNYPTYGYTPNFMKDIDLIYSMNDEPIQSLHDNNARSVTGFGSVNFDVLRDTLNNKIYLNLPSKNDEKVPLIKLKENKKGLTINFNKNKKNKNIYEDLLIKNKDTIKKILEIDISEKIIKKNMRLILSWDMLDFNINTRDYRENGVNISDDFYLKEAKKELTNLFDFELEIDSLVGTWSNIDVKEKTPFTWLKSEGTNSTIEFIRIKEADLKYAQKIKVYLKPKSHAKYNELVDYKYKLINKILNDGLLTITISGETDA
ncbi:S8 family serine peptidase [Mycoplasma sp. 1199]|uniref:S8 family serine peptidase n=1 Tax=Mycoplasma sp. 1199 TaxID=3108526 RepID=UPI002B1D7378|nr:S8 family serine peptidase [Mycoplasma sp. 1199]MEA4206057.1 S8 family serine peptidase [Mycoplasma sp. 1199]